MTYSGFMPTFAVTLAFFLFGLNPASAQEFMSKKEMLATIPGATLYGVSNSDGKTKWAQAYSKGRKKGKISGVFGEDKYEATWQVKGDMWCEDWGSGKGCFKFVRVSDKNLQVYKEGTKKLKNHWKIK